MENSIINFYRSKKELFFEAGKKYDKRVRLVSLYRLVSFLIIPFSLIYLTRSGIWLGVVTAVLSLIAFLFLVKKHISLNKERKRNKILIQLVEDEIEALYHRFSHFENGEEFISPGHEYSFDLDLFGDGSLFQFLNRTSTVSGKRVLAHWLQFLLLQKNEITDKQEAIKEIASKKDWRLNFLASGKMFNETRQQYKEVLSWAEKTLPFKRFNLIGVLKLGLPVLTLLMLIPAIWFDFSVPLYFFIGLQWAILYFYRKRIKEYFRFFGQKSQLIEKYVSLLNEIEKENFSSSLLISWKKKITDPESAGVTIAKLGKLVSEFEYRQNMIVALILNSFFLWDVRCIFKLRKWHIQNKNKLVEWIEVIENTDALISLANFTDNQPEFVFPEIKESDFVLDAEKLGHPLLNPKKRICSDFSIEGWPKTIVVTGANMAGKSTFLRAVGINLVLARIGAPVCASSFSFTPSGIYSNMRTTDSLFKDESYFYAELKRLSHILGKLQKGESLFIIIDEMLKGTNSVDKLKGSKELIRKLLNYNSVALIATHDLKLGEMENEFPGKIINKCFEIRIVNDELIFDYKLSDGITKTMNATFLMKKMGII